MGLRLLKMALTALLALAVGYAAALGVGLVAFDVFAVSQREGANAMGLLFVICPVVAVFSALVAAIWYWIASGQHRATTTPATVESQHDNAVRVALIAGSAIVGRLAGTMLQWMLSGRSYETFVVALAVAKAPWFGTIFLGGVTWWWARRLR